MKISVVTPSYNSGAFLEATIRSVLEQRDSGVDVEYIISDGGSTDESLSIIERYRDQIDVVISEPDDGPADAINRGFKHATGDVMAWLNADDVYCPGALARVRDAFEGHPGKAICFGHCPMMDEQGGEIRGAITSFKEFFYPFSCRFLVQSINYVSQPAMFFRRSAWEQAAMWLRTDMVAAWDYDMILRLWRHGGAARIANPALAQFRWHPASISGQHFGRQFKEEFDVAVADAGRFSPQVALHWCVRWGIVGIYSLMAARRGRMDDGL